MAYLAGFLDGAAIFHAWTAPLLHSIRLATGNDLWYQGGGAFQPATFGYVSRRR
jgi:hypothetical protein